MGNKTAFGFGTPFAEQLAFFRAKLNLPTERWDDIKRAAHDRAFIVAGAGKADLLDDLKRAVDKAIGKGTGLDEFRRDFKQIVFNRGWTGWTGEGTKAGEAWRTRIIYSTNMSTSYAAGRWQQLNHPDLLKARPYWRYHHADGVMHPRPHHKAWNGITLPHDHPFWKTHFAPNGWMCHCYISAVSAEEYAQAQADGKGQPPDGWNTLDAKTGAPVGIDKGFDYAPGANIKTQMQDFIDQKLIKLSPEIARALEVEVAPVLEKIANKAVTFTEQKTAKAAAEWAVSNNIADFADYTGIKPEVANEWNRSLFNHLQEFPELRNNQKFTGTSQAQFARWRSIEIERYVEKMRADNPNLPVGFDCRSYAEKWIKALKVDSQTWAHSWSQKDVSGISVNKKFGASVEGFKQSLIREELAKYHPVGCNTIRSVVDHELGHQLDDLLALHIDAEVNQVYQEAIAKGIKNEVSDYAGESIKEFIAECWAESINNPAPREYARRVAEIIRARYTNKFP